MMDCLLDSGVKMARDLTRFGLFRVIVAIVLIVLLFPAMTFRFGMDLDVLTTGVHTHSSYELAVATDKMYDCLTFHHCACGIPYTVIRTPPS